MEAEERRNSHDQVFSFKFILKWLYHKSHTCMCIDNPKRLITSQWPITAIFWLSYRILLAVITIMITVNSLADTILYELNEVKSAKYFIYLTRWGLVILATCFTTKACIALKYFAYIESDIELIRTTPLLLFSWISSNVNNVLALFITVWYWAFSYDGSQIKSVTPLYSHVVNSVVTILDLLMAEMPVHFAHIYQPILFSWTYLLFSYVYYVSGGTNEDGKREIYTVLNWANPSQTLLLNMVGGSGMCVVLQVLTVITSWTRTQIAKRVGRQRVVRAHRALILDN